MHAQLDYECVEEGNKSREVKRKNWLISTFKSAGVKYTHSVDYFKQIS